MEPRFLDSSTTPPDWISIRVNGQVRALPYAAQNGDRVVMRVRAPNDSDQSRVVQMVIGDLHPSVVLTTANIHAPPSLEDTMNAMEPPAPPMAPPGISWADHAKKLLSGGAPLGSLQSAISAEAAAAEADATASAGAPRRCELLCRLGGLLMRVASKADADAPLNGSERN